MRVDTLPPFNPTKAAENKAFLAVLFFRHTLRQTLVMRIGAERWNAPEAYSAFQIMTASSRTIASVKKMAQLQTAV